MRSHSFLAFLACAFLPACADALPERATAPTEAGASRNGESEEAELAFVARSVALALRDSALRVQVRDAMRASPVTEHKLVLQEFLRSAGGRAFAGAAAKAAGVAPEAFLARVLALRPMDFYVPFREHRLGWRGTPALVVGYTADPKALFLEGFDRDGRTLRLDLRGGPPAVPLLVVHAAERKSERIDPQPDVPGEVIQDPGDGELSGTLEWTDARGRTHRVALGGRRKERAREGESYALAEACSPTAVDTCDPSFQESGPGASDTTFVDTLWINYSDAQGAFGVEVELRATFYSGGVRVEGSTARFEGLTWDRWYAPHQPLIFRRAREGSTDYIRVHVVETDVFDDDHKGSRNFHPSDNGEVRSIIDDGNFMEGQSVTNVMLRWARKY